MQRMGEVFIPLAIAFMLLFALNVSGFAQATVPSTGTATSSGINLPAQNSGGGYRPGLGTQPGIGTTTPNSVPGRLPNTTIPNVTPNPNVMPNSTLPNQNPNMVPNPYPNAVPNVPYPYNPNPNPSVTNPNVTPRTEPGIFNDRNLTPYGTKAPGTGGAVGAGVPHR